METAELTRALGEVLRRLRLEKGISQENFAYEAGLHRTFMGMIERGNRNITLATFCKLAEAFKMSASDLLRLVEIEAQKSI